MQKKGIYMQNEFEKQVQQKMEELRLVPSDPVWEKVEMQIRKKKDRRAVIFWIPLLALVAVGLWFGIENYSNQTSSNQNTPLSPQSHSSNSPVTQNNSIDNSLPDTVDTKKPGSRTATGKTLSKTTSAHVDRKYGIWKPKTATPAATTDKKGSSSATETVTVNAKAGVNDAEVPLQKVTAPEKSQEEKETISNNEQKSAEQATAPVKHDSASVAPSLKKHALAKWKYNLVAMVGTSGLGRVEFYNGMKSASVYYSPSTGVSNSGGNQFSSYGPSAVEKGLAFAIAATAKKQLSRRMFFSSGLQYNYYSNTIQVGQQVPQNRILLGYSVSRYFTAQSSVSQPYKNAYHFISVPADLDWQMLRKHPLNLSLGLSFQYLLASNALRYDYTSQSYFHDMSALNRAQLFSAFALTYSVPLKQRPLSFGPQIQYGFTRIEKGNPDNHLFSYGLKAQWQLKN
jgi:cytoskeletal protein RodZ